MKKNKILVVEKDLLARQAVTRELKKSDRFDVFAISSLASGIQSTITKNNPSLILLNIDNLQSEEFEIFTKLRVRYPELPVVVLSPRNERGAKAGITALSMGAIDIVTKPTRYNKLLFANRHLAKRLIPIIENAATCADKRVFGNKGSAESGGYDQSTLDQLPVQEAKAEKKELGVIVIGACTGGPMTLFTLFENLPKNFPVPIVVVQHLPRIFTKVLAEELDSRSQLQVSEVYEGAELNRGRVWIAPGGYHTEIHQEGCKTFLRTHRGGREHGERPAIDILFRSAAKYFGANTLAIVLGGIGMDGFLGAEAIQAAGGEVLIQDPNFSKAPCVNLKILRAGITDKTCKPEDIAAEILSRVPPKYWQQADTGSEGSARMPHTSTINHLDYMEFNTL